MKKSECANQCFLNGFNCAQAVFSTYSGDLGLEAETALKISCGFGAGMAYTGETCGAVTGALMLIGLKNGKVRAEDEAAKEKTYALVQEFAHRFIDVHGSLKCKDLLGYDISHTDELNVAREKQLFNTVCPRYVVDACVIVEELLEINK